LTGGGDELLEGRGKVNPKKRRRRSEEGDDQPRNRFNIRSGGSDADETMEIPVGFPDLFYPKVMALERFRTEMRSVR
jgi:hypothetical protein